MQPYIDSAKPPYPELDFTHTELLAGSDWASPALAALASSVLETGADPASVSHIRKTLMDKALPPYGCLTPTMVDAIVARASNTAEGLH